MATVAAVQSLGRTDWTDSVFCKIEVRSSLARSLPRPHYHYPVVWCGGWLGGRSGDGGSTALIFPTIRLPSFPLFVTR